PVASWEQLQQQIAGRSDALKLELLRPEAVQAPGGTLWSEKPVSLTLPAPDAPGAYGLEASDLTLFAVQPGGAADQAGLKRGDRVLSVNGVPAYSWGDEVDPALKAAGTQPVEIIVRREGKTLTVTARQHLRKDRHETGIMVDMPDLGASPDLNSFGDAPRIWLRYPIPEALRRSFSQTVEFVRVQSIGIARIVTGHISSRAIGGPLMIAKVAREAAEAGWRYF